MDNIFVALHVCHFYVTKRKVYKMFSFVNLCIFQPFLFGLFDLNLLLFVHVTDVIYDWHFIHRLNFIFYVYVAPSYMLFMNLTHSNNWYKSAKNTNINENFKQVFFHKLNRVLKFVVFLTFLFLHYKSFFFCNHHNQPPLFTQYTECRGFQQNNFLHIGLIS